MALSSTALFYRLEAALAEGGIDLSLLNEPHNRPLLIDTAIGEHDQKLRVFLWNVTHGGASRALDEYRVQTTRPGEVPFLVEGERTTLLLGYHEATDVFAAWDARLHPNPASSSSLQVSLWILEEARDLGLASLRRDISGDQEEIVMAFAPQQLGDYLRLLPSYLTAVPSEEEVGLVGAPITSGEAPKEEDLPDDQERRTAIREVTVVVRDARFRKKVIDAYGGRCAFCGLGLGLLDAAHIKAVQFGGSDSTQNGLAACPTHHRAFDRGLLYVDEARKIVINAARVEFLGFDETGIDDLAQGLFEELASPASPSSRPSEAFLGFHRDKWHLEAD